jgi:small subunit ribosomal protein S19e
LPTVYDVPADECIREVAEYLQANVPEVSPPEWHRFVKTGAHRERTPEDSNWWYTRSASILRKIYISEPIGVSRLRLLYGGKKRSGNAPAHFARGSGAVIHNILRQLETAGLVETVEGKGRILTKTGKGMLDRCATRIKKRLEKDIPSLKVY